MGMIISEFIIGLNISGGGPHIQQPEEWEDEPGIF